MSTNAISLDAIRSQIPSSGDTQAKISTLGQVYREMVGFVPPRIQARFEITGALDAEMLDLQERIRTHAMYPGCFDQKTVQLLLFGMLLMDLSDATLIHGLAARRAGASWEEMQAVISLCYLFRGLSAANRGAEFLAQIAQKEANTSPSATESTQ